MSQIVPFDTLNALKDFDPWEATITDAKDGTFAISPTVAADKRLIVLHPIVTLGDDSAASALVRVGFAAADLGAEAAAGVGGIIAGHGSLAPGSGFHGNSGMGAAGEELRIENTTPTPGKLKITYLYKIVSA